MLIAPILNYCLLLRNHRCSRSQNEFSFPMTFVLPFDYRFTRNSRTNQVKHHFCYSFILKEMKDIFQLLSISNPICLSFSVKIYRLEKTYKGTQRRKTSNFKYVTVQRTNPYQPGSVRWRKITYSDSTWSLIPVAVQIYRERNFDKKQRQTTNRFAHHSNLSRPSTLLSSYFLLISGYSNSIPS